MLPSMGPGAAAGPRPSGRVNNAVYVDYLEEALHAAGVAGRRAIAAVPRRVRLEYLAAAALDADVLGTAWPIPAEAEGAGGLAPRRRRRPRASRAARSSRACRGSHEGQPRRRWVIPLRERSSRVGHPAFARPDAGAPCARAELLADSRPARLVRASGMPDLEALQARAVADPGWFWGLAVDDLDLSWERPWDRVLDLGAGIEWPRWWSGGAFDHAAAVRARWASRPDDEAMAWEGDDGSVRRLTARG